MLLFLSSLLLAGAAMGAPAQYCPSPVQPAVASPSPLQPGTVANCNKFHKVTKGENCTIIAKNAGISVDEFRSYNPVIDDKCTNVLLGYYVCLSANGTPIRPKIPPGNIVVPPAPVPSPLRDGIAANCNKYYQVQHDEACIIVAGYFGITFADLRKLNAGIDDKCSNLAVGSYACVSANGTPISPKLPPGRIIEHPVTPPSPLQLGVVVNCNKFYQVQGGEICNTVANYFGITFDVLRIFNAGIDETCTNLAAGSYACVSVDGPIPPAPAAKYQLGAVENCVKYYTVTNGQDCNTVAQKNNISVADLRRFNTKIDEKCTNLIAGADACVVISGAST